jgi:1-acyl-sn-glycerol-3-phosphate acyltransferase
VTTRPSATGTDFRPVDPRAYRFARLLLRLVFGGYIRTKVSGREHLPPLGTATLVTANHTSSLDVFAAGYAVDRPGHFVAKVEATRIPLFGRLLLACGAIPAARDGRDLAVLRQARAVLEHGELMGIAPEGTRSPDGRLGAYDPGFVWLASRTGATIVPCAIHGAWQLMPKGADYPRPGRLWVRFGPAIVPPSGEAELSREALAGLAGQVRQSTLELLGQLAAETGVPNPAVEGP